MNKWLLTEGFSVSKSVMEDEGKEENAMLRLQSPRINFVQTDERLELLGKVLDFIRKTVLS